MKLFDKILSREHGSKETSPADHMTVVNQRAKALIEELVSPLSEPNQRVIDEVLDIITRSSTLPDHMVNKEAVQRTTKQLLFQLVEPISNPNKQLIDELLQLVTHSGPFLSQENRPYQKPQPDMMAGTAMPQQKPYEQPAPEKPAQDDEYSEQNPRSEAEERHLKGQAGLKIKREEALASAPFPSQVPAQTTLKLEKKEKETRSIMNLLLEQIKELITITNNLNTKFKSQQVRIDTLDSSFKDIQKKAQEVEERMGGFEKNMEKFIGLYEVVTNQYNPFVEAAATANTAPQPEAPAPQPEPAKPKFFIDGQEMKDLNQFSDSLLALSDDAFNSQVLGKKEDLLKWLKEVLEKSDLASELENLDNKNDYIKSVFKSIHS